MALSLQNFKIPRRYYEHICILTGASLKVFAGFTAEWNSKASWLENQPTVRWERLATLKIFDGLLSCATKQAIREEICMSKCFR